MTLPQFAFVYTDMVSCSIFAAYKCGTLLLRAGTAAGAGSCCPADAWVDAMGVCRGNAKAMDVQGWGCNSGVVDAQGICCEVPASWD